MSEHARGLDIGSAVQMLLGPDRMAEFAPDGPNIEQAVSRIAHIKMTLAEARTAMAYLALQAGAYQRLSNEDSALTLRNIERIISEHRAHRERLGMHDD